MIMFTIFLLRYFCCCYQFNNFFILNRAKLLFFSPLQDLLPLVFMFDVPVSSANQLNPDFSPILDHIQQHYGVNVSLKPHHQPYIRTVLIRGSVYNMKSARQAATLIFEHLTGRTGVSLNPIFH